MYSPPHGSTIPPPLLLTDVIPSRSCPAHSWMSVLLSHSHGRRCGPGGIPQHLTHGILALLINEAEVHLFICARSCQPPRMFPPPKKPKYHHIGSLLCKLKLVECRHSRKTARRTFWLESLLSCGALTKHF